MSSNLLDITFEFPKFIVMFFHENDLIIGKKDILSISTSSGVIFEPHEKRAR